MEIVHTRKLLCSLGVPVFLLVILGLAVARQSRGPQEPVSADQSPLLGTDGKINLRILCTTSPKTGRTDDFVRFLSQHFVKVATADYATFDESAAEGFDVVIIDYGTTRPGSPVPERLSRNYCRATVTMGVAGSEVGGRLGLKTGYL